MQANVKVLLVDDNPMVLEMLRAALDPLAHVSTSTDGADALLKLIDEPPDLLISDFRMPGLDGQQLLDKIRSRASTAKMPVILLASRVDITDKLRGLQSVEELLEKPFFLRDATARIKKAIDRIALEKMAREAPGEGVLRGSLAQMNVMDLLQSLELGHKTCKLVLSSDGERCEMYFTDGQINHAVYGPLKGDDAVYKVLGWPGGSFTIDFTGKSAEQTCTRSTQGLLMEGLRLIDEANRDAEENILET
ncbi:MAG TPA: response regulator [Candidatus Acidoferrales bacterium]|nr:response regulator [Candidatus Acidoferrales bacterium]